MYFYEPTHFETPIYSIDVPSYYYSVRSVRAFQSFTLDLGIVFILNLFNSKINNCVTFKFITEVLH